MLSYQKKIRKIVKFVLSCTRLRRTGFQVTTAVLAGLTLGTVKNNDVVAHADATPTQSQTVANPTEQNKPAAEEQSAADKTAEQISNVQKEVTNVQNGNEANKGIQKTTDADKAAAFVKTTTALSKP